MEDRALLPEPRDCDTESEFSQTDRRNESNIQAYTLLIVIDPSEYETLLDESRMDSSYNKGKRIVLNQVKQKPDVVASFSYNEGQKFQGIRAVEKSEKRQGSVLSKIVTFRDVDTFRHPVEKTLGRWAGLFHEKLAQYCVKKPRYSELRPMKFVFN